MRPSETKASRTAETKGDGTITPRLRNPGPLHRAHLLGCSTAHAHRGPPRGRDLRLEEGLGSLLPSLAEHSSSPLTPQRGLWVPKRIRNHSGVPLQPREIRTASRRQAAGLTLAGSGVGCAVLLRKPQPRTAGGLDKDRACWPRRPGPPPPVVLTHRVLTRHGGPRVRGRSDLLTTAPPSQGQAGALQRASSSESKAKFQVQPATDRAGELEQVFDSLSLSFPL